MKRANGTGSIVKLSGNRRRPYCVRISERDRHGHIIQRAVSYHAKASEAQAALDELNARRDQGLKINMDKFSMTWGQAYDLWSARKFGTAGPSSVASYRASWRRVGVLASRKARDITIDDLQRIIDQDEADGLSMSSIDNDHILMRALYRYLLERDVVAKDYSAFVELPRVEAKHEKGALDDLQLHKLEKLAAAGVPWADTVLILCYTGMRINEFLALTPFCYDRDSHCITGGSKTDAGRDRIIPVHPKIQPYLDRWLADGCDTIIHRDAKPVRAHWYRKHPFRAIMEQIGADGATPHWCRHTFISRARMAGVDELAIKRIVGHSTKGDVTAGYTHLDSTWLAGELAKIA